MLTLMFLERYSLLGNRQEYWEYFVEALKCGRKTHDGIRFVKVNKEVSFANVKSKGMLQSIDHVFLLFFTY